MKKSISAILSILLVFVFVLFAVGSSSSDDGGSTEQQSAGEVQSVENENNIGDYTVEIKDARFTETYDGKPAIVVTYGFTNNSDNPAAFYIAFETDAYQNDIGLNEAYVLKDGDPYSEDNQSKEIKTGASLDVEVAYELNDTESDVVIEVEEFMGWSDDKVTKTFTIK